MRQENYYFGLEKLLVALSGALWATGYDESDWANDEVGIWRTKRRIS